MPWGPRADGCSQPTESQVGWRGRIGQDARGQRQKILLQTTEPREADRQDRRRIASPEGGEFLATSPAEGERAVSLQDGRAGGDREPSARQIETPATLRQEQPHRKEEAWRSRDGGGDRHRQPHKISNEVEQRGRNALPSRNGRIQLAEEAAEVDGKLLASRKVTTHARRKERARWARAQGASRGQPRQRR
jgi:hypothetical protein